MRIVHTENAPAAIGPYAQAMVANGMVFTSGQIALSPETGTLDGTTIQEQTERAIKNLDFVLEAAGSDLEHVIKTTCFLRRMSDFASFNEIYARYFTGKPARSCVEASGLPKGALVEIECVAELKDQY